ncbi:conserved hypothetical protein [delta proteobacterium NaphS2]|nr:conserved hypothetical protein [delta proteobacterium NaphS2]
MKRSILLLTAVLFFFPLSGTTFAIPGATDKVPAATLVVPFFETDMAGGIKDTLVVVTNAFDSTDHVHWEVWDIDGNLSGIYGNFTLGPFETWVQSMRAIISAASTSAKFQLTVGNVYRGFVTFDMVSSYTDSAPIWEDYPFDFYNDLEGYVYYTRLTEGSANGLNMIPLEYVGSSVDDFLNGFYQEDDGREQFDSDARACAEAIIYGYTCPYSEDMYQIDSRVFLNPGLSAESRIILFAWSTWWDGSGGGGPSDICSYYGDCATAYPYIRFDEAGNAEQDTTISLHHVVNVINVSGTKNGWVSIWDVPSGINNGQIFAFSFNSASPPSASTNWDAIFESYMIPDYGEPVMLQPARAGHRVPGTLKQP